jgi:hypothetical protein
MITIFQEKGGLFLISTNSAFSTKVRRWVLRFAHLLVFSEISYILPLQLLQVDGLQRLLCIDARRKQGWFVVIAKKRWVVLSEGLKSVEGIGFLGSTFKQRISRGRS